MTGEDLKALRTELCLTQTELAEKIGVARNTINRWEMGIRGIPEPVARLMQYVTQEKVTVARKKKPGKFKSKGRRRQHGNLSAR